MDYESARITSLGCWDGYAANTPIIKATTSSTPTPAFVISDETCKAVLDRGFGPELSGEAKEFWIRELKRNYSGDDGRKRLRMAAINLRDRDGLHGRLGDVRCPVLWLHVSFVCWKKTSSPADGGFRVRRIRFTRLGMLRKRLSCL